MTENPLDRFTNRKRTKISKPSSHHGPNEIFVAAMKSVGDSLKGQMYFYLFCPVMIVDVIAPVMNNFGDPTSGIKVTILVEEKMTDITCLDWEDFRSKFKTKEEHEKSREALQIQAEEVRDDQKTFYELKKQEFEAVLPEIKSEIRQKRNALLKLKTKIVNKTFLKKRNENNNNKNTTF